jgi:REP element-mobilizing transposase RayT
MRTSIGAVLSFGGKTRLECGDTWWTWYRWIPEKYRAPLSIVFSEVATHNHFVLERGGKVFKQTAPVIKLPPSASEDDHLALLGLLNSSTACFWLKQVCHNKGSTVDQHGARQRTAPFEDFYAFNSTKLEGMPLTEERPTELAHKLHDLAQSLQSHAPGGLLERWECRGIMPGSTIKESFENCRRQWGEIRERMVALQEELDWECYRLYGLVDEDLTYDEESPESDVGQPPPAVLSSSTTSTSHVGQPPPAVPSHAGTSQTRPMAKRTPAEYRRNLPHLQAEGKTYAITFCTKDRWVLPEEVLDRVLQHCLHDHGVKLHMHAAVVMPDHVHLLLTPGTDLEGNTYGLSEIMSGIKGASAHSINRMLKRKGPVWQDESFDHILRSDERIEARVEYLSQNPVRKGLAAQPEDYPWLWREWVEGRKAETAGGGCPTGMGTGTGTEKETAGGGCPTPTQTQRRIPGLMLGQRAFEIVLARKVAAGETQTTWFEHHGSTAITKLPAEWPDDYRRLVDRRIQLI